MKTITQKLRTVEMTYVLASEDHLAIRRARELITKLWELHRENPTNQNQQAAGLFENAGLGMNK